MLAPKVDTTRWEQMVDIFRGMLQHRRTHPTTKSEELYFELLLKYYSSPLPAEAGGKPVVAHCLLIPTELFVAMDVVPLHMEGAAQAVLPTLKNYEESFSAAKGLGFPPELCSAHRSQIALFAQGIWPRVDAVVWSHQICDGSIKTGELYHRMYNIPGFYLDRPFIRNDEQIKYYAEELEELVHFLEKIAGRSLDKARLQEVMELSHRTVDLHRQIYELRKTIPAPMANRRSSQLQNIQWLFIGTPEAVTYHEMVLQEMKELVEQKRGFVPEEKFRILSLFPPPSHDLKLLDWMEKEHGAILVADPYCSHWGDFEWDDSQPFLTLSRKGFATPMSRSMHGPADEGMVPDIIQDAVEFKAQGAIYWAHIGCRTSCAMIRTVKDALREKVGIPTLVLDMDILDPSFVSDAQMKEKLEGFFETLASGS